MMDLPLWGKLKDLHNSGELHRLVEQAKTQEYTFSLVSFAYEKSCASVSVCPCTAHALIIM